MNIIQKRNLFLFFSGRLISLIGSGIQSIAIPLYILDKTGSGALMGVFTMLVMAPMLLMAPLSGVLGDRLNRIKIVIISDYGRGILVLLMAGLALAGRMNLTILFVCQIFISLMDSLFNATTAAMLPELVEKEELSRVNAVKGGADSVAMIIGPIFGAIIYSLWGIKMVFFINALSFIISAICETLIAYQAKTRGLKKLDLKTFFNEVGETLAYIFQHSGLKQLFLFAMVMNFLANPIILVGTPYVLKKIIGFSNQQYSYLMTLYILGVLFGNILIGSLFAKTSIKKLMKPGLIMNAIGFVLYGIIIFPKITRYFGGASWKYFITMGVGIMATGVFNAFVNTPLMTNLQKMVRDEMRARFFSVLGLVSQLAIPIGAVIFGFLLDKVSTHYLILMLGLLYLFITIAFVMLSSPEVYEPRGMAVNSPISAEK